MAEEDGSSGGSGEKSKADPALRSRTGTGPRPAADPKSGPALSGAAKTGPALSSAGKTGPVPSSGAGSKPGPAVTGRRPLVSKEAKEQKAALAAKAPKPFYKRIPKSVLKVMLALAVIAALIPVSIWGYRAFQRSKNPDEYAVREQLYTFRFDNDQAHFTNLDAMGPKAVDISIKLLVDRTEAEIEGGKTTTTAGELAQMYLMHYAIRVKVEPPPKAVEAMHNGLPTLNSGQWTDLQQAWTTWFADVKAKGLALK